MAVSKRNQARGRAPVTKQVEGTAGAPARTHPRPLPVQIDLNQVGRLRAGHLMSLLAIGHTTLYDRLRRGQIPPPHGYDGARPFWKTRTLREFLDPDAPRG